MGFTRVDRVGSGGYPWVRVLLPSLLEADLRYSITIGARDLILGVKIIVKKEIFILSIMFFYVCIVLFSFYME
ncbi:unnamed protein product [Linum trigynum]|uniref:Uncharacterized protein n=1 Tax=Linum trigynum TaxID=586398 RepID=A0AAV2FM32_9ROSI